MEKLLKPDKLDAARAVLWSGFTSNKQDRDSIFRIKQSNSQEDSRFYFPRPEVIFQNKTLTMKREEVTEGSVLGQTD